MFSYSKFLPYGNAFRWHPGVLWLHIISDGLTAVAFFSIAIALLYFVFKRPDLTNKKITLLFGLFILFCGFAHLADVYVIWVPDYQLQGLLKALAAALSVLTAIALWPLIPAALKIPEPRLFEDSKRLASIVVGSQDAILSKSLDGTILTWNEAAERMFQFSNEEMIGRSVYEIVPASRHNEERVAFEKLKRGEPVEPYETIRLRKDGSEFPVYILMSPIFNDSGQVVACSSIIRDVTQKQKMVEELEGATELLKERNRELISVNKAKDEFIANLSHELRSPLNIILGYTQLMENYDPSDPQFRDGLDAIKRNASTQLRLVEDLLDMSRIISGKFSLSVGSHNLKDIVDTAVKSVEFAARAKWINIETKIETTEQTIICDADRLQQVLWNLLTNAMKFTPQRGHIAVTVNREGVDFVFSVTDTGIGIAPQDMPHIFDRLWQKTGATDNGQVMGLGLGLNISRDLAQAHGGRLTVSSKGPGQGSTFTVRIPVQAIAPNETPERVEEKLPLNNLNILVVDDSPDAVALIRVVLQKAGAKVVTATNGADALELVRQDNIQFIISDINMPIMDGYAFMKNARLVESTRGNTKIRPAIALTARVGPGEKERAYQSGYQLHLIKPVQPQVLVEKVVSVLRQWKNA